MGCSVSALLLLTMLPTVVTARQQADSVPLSPVLQQRVTQAVAGMWSLEPDRLRLEWGVVRQGRTLSDEAAFRLVGKGTDGWFVVIFEADGGPLAARLRVASVDSVFVATRPLTADASLTAADMTYAERTRWGLSPPLEDALPPVGWRVRRAMAAGESLSPPRIAPPLLVLRGEQVQLVWSRGTLRIAIEGIAVNAAALGDEVRVRLADRRGNARGIVTGPGRADLIGSITR